VATVDRTRTIAAAEEQIWDVLADFGAIGSWVAKIEHSCILVQGDQPVGTSRRVQFGREALVETIVEFDPPRVLAYRIEGLPKVMGRMSNRWSLHPVGGSTVVTVTSAAEIGSGAMQQLAERAACRVLARESGVMLVGLANRLERSRV
jgi:Polyketide cyclase / dehydrase and lipid transport